MVLDFWSTCEQVRTPTSSSVLVKPTSTRVHPLTLLHSNNCFLKFLFEKIQQMQLNSPLFLPKQNPVMKIRHNVTHWMQTDDDPDQTQERMNKWSTGNKAWISGHLLPSSGYIVWLTIGEDVRWRGGVRDDGQNKKGEKAFWPVHCVRVKDGMTLQLKTVTPSSFLVTSEFPDCFLFHVERRRRLCSV